MRLKTIMLGLMLAPVTFLHAQTETGFPEQGAGAQAEQAAAPVTPEELPVVAAAGAGEVGKSAAEPATESGTPAILEVSLPMEETTDPSSGGVLEVSLPSAAPGVATGRERPAAVYDAKNPLLVPGSGQTIGGMSPMGEPIQGDALENYNIDFVEEEISTIVAAILGDTLGLAYVIDPRVKGTMTFQGAGAVKRSDIVPFLETALRTQELALVEIGGTYHVLPQKDAARQSGLGQQVSEKRPGYSVRIVPLRYVGAQEMEKILRPLSPDGSILRADDVRNALLISGTSREIDAMLGVISLFDVDWLSGMSYALLPLTYVDPKSMVTELEELFSGQKSPISGAVRLLPLQRLNSVMVVTPQPHYLQAVAEWVKRLDLAVETSGHKIYVYEAQNAKAADLARSLNQILSGRTEARSESRGSSMMGSKGEGSDTSETSIGVRNVANIVPNEETNSLLIMATAAEYAAMESAIKQLDVMPLQILLEASLAEVTLNDDMRFGLQWSFLSGEGPVVLSDAANGSINQKFPGFSYLFTGKTDIRAVLNALQTVTDVNVVSSPKLLVLNNHEAKLQVGDQVPIVVQSSVSTNDPDAPIVNSVSMRDTGVILSVTPRVNKSGLALLEINQEVSDVVATTTSNIDSPTIQQRRLSSTVAVRDGETIALGGLIRDNRSRGRSGIPFLSQIPVVGTLFGSINNNRRRTEFIVLITPRVLRSSEEASSSFQELKEQFKKIGKDHGVWSSHTRKEATP